MENTTQRAIMDKQMKNTTKNPYEDDINKKMLTN